MGRPRLIVGLTGGIGSGKSTVSRRFEDLGVPVIDADVLARELVLPGSPVLDQIRQQFGPEFIAPDGGLDRARMREHIFANPAARKELEALLHPPIRQRMREWLDAQQAPYAVLVIPLLFETGQAEMVDRILVVDLPEAIQIERVIARSGLDEQAVRDIMAAQHARARRMAEADDVIDNSSTTQALLDQVDALHQRYLALATATAHDD